MQNFFLRVTPPETIIHKNDKIQDKNELREFWFNLYYYIHHILRIFRCTVTKSLVFLLKVTEIKLPVTCYLDKLKSEN